MNQQYSIRGVKRLLTSAVSSPAVGSEISISPATGLSVGTRLPYTVAGPLTIKLKVVSIDEATNVAIGALEVESSIGGES